MEGGLFGFFESDKIPESKKKKIDASLKKLCKECFDGELIHGSFGSRCSNEEDFKKKVRKMYGLRAYNKNGLNFDFIYKQEEKKILCENKKKERKEKRKKVSLGNTFKLVKPVLISKKEMGKRENITVFDLNSKDVYYSNYVPKNSIKKLSSFNDWVHMASQKIQKRRILKTLQKKEKLTADEKKNSKNFKFLNILLIISMNKIIKKIIKIII